MSQYAPVGRVLPYGHSGRTARGVPLSSSGPNINAAAMGDVQQPSRMSRWSKEVPSHVQDEEEEASKRQRVERPLPCAEGGGEAGPSADDSDSACEAQEEGEEEELEDEEVGEEEAVRKTGVSPPPPRRRQTSWHGAVPCAGTSA